jgi:hypothetical protein
VAARFRRCEHPTERRFWKLQLQGRSPLGEPPVNYVSFWGRDSVCQRASQRPAHGAAQVNTDVPLPSDAAGDLLQRPASTLGPVAGTATIATVDDAADSALMPTHLLD